MKIMINGHEVEGTPEEIRKLVVMTVDNRNFNFNCVPEACRICPNHRMNGGSGICNCTLGLMKVMC